MPAHEARRVARDAAEKRRRSQKPGQTGSGQRLGGPKPRPGKDIRGVIAEAAEGRTKTLKGCGTEKLSETQIRDMADTANRNGFRTQAEEDDANEAAIATALWELVQEDEQAKYGSSYIPPSAQDPVGNGGGSVMPNDSGSGAYALAPSRSPGKMDLDGPELDAGEIESDTWPCDICTLHNPPTYLTCDACGTERPEGHLRKPERAPRPSRPNHEPPIIDLTSSPPRRAARERRTKAPRPTPLTWNCRFCSTAMDQQWWTCSTCGQMKDSS